ncbi:MAG: hypothetical protein AB8Z32_02545, partial [Coxiella-like endosymbiont]
KQETRNKKQETRNKIDVLDLYRLLIGLFRNFIVGTGPVKGCVLFIKNHEKNYRLFKKVKDCFK